MEKQNIILEQLKCIQLGDNLQEANYAAFPIVLENALVEFSSKIL